MATKSILVGMICEENPPDDAPINFAIDSAAREKAHLSFAIVAPEPIVLNANLLASTRDMVATANAERREMAKTLAELYRSQALSPRSGRREGRLLRH